MKIKYFLYTRKSSESDERQVQSLDDQIKIMKAKAINLGIEIIDEFQESMSAKAPGRYKFNEMIQRIEKGEAKGIISWKLDRISRNPIDSGTIQYMLQNGSLDKIITNDKEYNPSDAGLLMSVENGMSNQFILDLKKNVKRGMNSKVDKGIFPGRAPEGYKNNRLNKTIEIDEENFILIQKAWKLMLTGTYTVLQILYIINNKWGYKKINSHGGKQISQSGLYAIFKNPFYTGDFLWKGEVKKGIHKAMISWEEFNRVQQITGNKLHITKGYTREFSFTGMIKCGECGGAITAEEKSKFNKTSGSIKNYVYYRCTKRKTGCNCKQKPVNLTKLENQINDILDNIEILPQFKEWGLKHLKENFKETIKEKENIINGLEKNIKTLERKQIKLLDYLMDETINKEEYEKIKASNIKDLDKYNRQLDKFKTEKDDSIELTEELIDLMFNVRDKFNNGNLKTKKLIFSSLGENFSLKDGVLALELHPWLIPLNYKLKNIKREYRRLELSKKASSKVNTKDFNDVITLWYPGQGSNLCLPLRRGLFFHGTTETYKKFLHFIKK